MDRGTWRTAVHEIEKSWPQLDNSTCTHSPQGSVTYEVFQCSGWGQALFPVLCGDWVIVISHPFEWFFPWFWVVYLHAYADQYTQGGSSTDDRSALSAALPSPGFCCAGSGFLSLSGPFISTESRQELPRR